MRRRIAIGATLAAILAVLAAGCGGDDGGSAGGGELTKEEYVTQLNQICADFNEKQTEIGEPQSLEEVGELGPQILDEFQKALDRARDLDPPSEIEEQANRFIELGEQQHETLSELVDAAKDNDQAKVQEAGTKVSALDEESDQIANELGAPACAED